MSRSSTDTEPAEVPKHRRKGRKALIRWLLGLLLLPFVVVAVAVLLLYLPPIQEMARAKGVAYLQDRTGSTVQLEKLHLRFPLGLRLEGLYAADEQGDTLLYAGTLKVDVGLRALTRKRIVMDPISLSDVRAIIRQKGDSSFNFDFIVQAFTTNDPAEVVEDTEPGGGFAFSIGSVHLTNVSFTMELAPEELSMELALGELVVDFDSFVTDPLQFHVDQLELNDTRIALRTTTGEPTPDPYPHLVGPLADIDIQFKTLELNRVEFSMLTTDTRDSLWLGLDHASVVAHGMDLGKQRVALDKVHVVAAQFGMLNKERSEAFDTLRTEPPWLNRNDGFRYWTRNWDLSIAQLSIDSSSVAIHNNNELEPARFFDTDHLTFTAITLDATACQVNNDHVGMELQGLSAQGGPRYTVVELALDLDATEERIALSKGSFRSSGNELTFRVHIEPDGLSKAYRAPRSIPMDLEASTTLRLDRLMPLLAALDVETPDLSSVQEEWETELAFTGSMDEVERVGLSLIGDLGSRIDLIGSAQKGRAWPNTTFELDLSQFTMGKGLEQVIRAYLPAGTHMPEQLALRCHAIGRDGDLRAVLALQSDRGRISGTCAVNRWHGVLPNDLEFDLTASELNVGAFLNDTTLEAMDLKLAGSATDLFNDERSGTMMLTPSVLRYAGNDLSSLRLTVEADKDTLRAALSSQAEALDIMLRATAPWPGKGDSTLVDVDLLMNEIRLRDLGLTGHALNINGRIIGELALGKGNYGRASIRADGTQLSNERSMFRFERIHGFGLFTSDSTALVLDSDAITLDYHNNLGIDSLIPRSRAKLLSYFKEHGSTTVEPGRRMEMTLSLPRTEWLTGMVFPELKAIELRTFRLQYDSDQDRLGMIIDIPHADHAGVEIHGLDVTVEAVDTRLSAELTVKSVAKDSVMVENFSLQALTGSNSLAMTMRLLDGEKEQYRIGTTMRREEGVPVLRMDSSFVLDHRHWTSYPLNALFFTDGGLRAEHFELRSDHERIALRTGTKRNHIELGSFRLATLTDMLDTPDSIPLVAGTVDGTISLPFVEDGRMGANLKVIDLRTRGVELGTLNVSATEMERGHFRAEIALLDPRNQMSAKADLDLGGELPIMQADAQLDFRHLEMFKPFVQDYLCTLEGGMKGNVRIRKAGDELTANGRVQFINAGVGVIQTGATYRLPEETVVIDDKGLLFDNMTILDSAGNRFRLDGRVHTRLNMDPELDLRLRTERFQLVNSTIEDNPMFFGDLFGSMDLAIRGTALTPIVSGEAGILEGTHASLVLPGSKVELVEHEGIVVFTEDFDAPDSLVAFTDSELLRDSLAAQLPGIELDLHFTVDERAEFAVVIDPTTGDQATFSGKGELVFRYSPDGELYISGPFTVTKGGYTLEFYGLVMKRFDLVPGGSVTWNGDPLKGTMALQARYRSELAPYPLVANSRSGLTEDEKNRLQKRVPFDLLINFNGTIEEPLIGFALDMDRQDRVSNPQVSNRLDQLAQPSNEEELNRQVFGMLVFNSFIEDEAAESTSSSNLATTAAQNSVNSILTNQMNALTGQVIHGVDIELGLNTYDQTQGSQQYQTTKLDYKVSKRIMNDRISVEAGGAVNMSDSKQDATNTSTSNAPQYAVTYDLTRDGRIRLRLFRENAYDLYDGEIIRNGLAITLTREFEENGEERKRQREQILQSREATRPENE